MAAELEFDLRETMDWDRKGFVDFNAGKTQLVLLDWSKNTRATDVKMDGSILEEKSSFKMLGDCLSLLNWIGTHTLSILLKLPQGKLQS